MQDLSNIQTDDNNPESKTFDSNILLQEERLRSLIDFAQQSARLKISPTTDFERHGIFHRSEHELISLPGIHLNIEKNEIESWLKIDRLTETLPPEPKEDSLSIWIDLPRKPEKAPSLKNAVLLEPNKLNADTINNHEIEGNLADQKLTLLSEFENKDYIERIFQEYVSEQWNTWAIEEKKRRQTIKLYSDLFTLKQQLEGSIIDTQIELIWGIGLGLWKVNDTNIKYPLITQSVEIFLNQEDMSIEIRPRRTADSIFELDPYMSIDGIGLADLQKAHNDLVLQQSIDVSPFERLTYEPQLQLATTHIDSKGIYWPNQTQVDDRQLPEITTELKITDTWVIFARPRSKSPLIQDLENFKKLLNQDEDCEITNVIKDIISEPSEEHCEQKLTNFRGLSYINSYSCSDTNTDVQDLFFPLPFNQEQVNIVQKLEHSNGVVVQGPPGTGKTHTIANIISHYMANGKRVLVTSMKEPALSVLKEKLPASIQPLAISLLTNEPDGMKQFEFAISKIAQELQNINKSELGKEIENDEELIDQLHSELAWIDNSIIKWARNNMQPIIMDNAEIYPEDAAQEIANAKQDFDWLDDPISIGNEYKPLFDNVDIIHLREARKKLKNDIDYLDKKIPKLELIPELSFILTLHQGLLNNNYLKEQVFSSNIPKIINLAENINALEELLKTCYEYQSLISKIAVIETPWIGTLQNFIRNPELSALQQLIESFLLQVNDLQIVHNLFIEKPVFIPEELEFSEEIVRALKNKSEGKQPFGIGGIVTKRTLIKKLETIRILNKIASTKQDWEHVYNYVVLQLNINELILKWNRVVNETNIFTVVNQTTNKPLKQIKEELVIYFKMKKLFEKEIHIKNQLNSFIEASSFTNDLFGPNCKMNELINVLQNNINYHRSSKNWSEKENLINKFASYNGRISELFNNFFIEELGKLSITDDWLQTRWHYLNEELRRIHSLKPALDDVSSITNIIIESGGINWAKKLKEIPMEGAVDYLLPDNWEQAWRLRRLANYFYSVSHFNEFKKLTSNRYDIEKKLASTYQNIVAKRTWLQLAKNATPDIRAALQAFQSAISKIGKGTGKRAVRYKNDAKNASSRTNKAIPCWIMPHYKISESLPPAFGCFDLVVIDEASQSDLTALPAILRAKKLLVVGDDKQVSPDGVGLEEEKITKLMLQFLSNQVGIYRQAMSPERSIYDLCKIVFANSQVMLREHFRSVNPIIEYSKREFYNHELKPLRIPTKSERLDPPLIDVFIEDGHRNNKENIAEAKFIVNEIKKIISDTNMDNRSIGVVSLLGNEQARKIWEMIQKEISTDKITRHKITCGDALTFQGKERDIMFLSMVATRDNIKADSREASAQRFNVAASRARDRMYLVRSIDIEDLSIADKLRRGLIEHFKSPFAQDDVKVKNLRELCESGFEKEVYDLLTERGYKVTPQVKVGNYRIDMVVEGHNDSRLAIECDGDRYHDSSKWEDDMNRQRILERAGWKFWRCFASNFVLNRKQVTNDLIETLIHNGIEPIGAEGVLNNIHCEHRTIKSLIDLEN